MRFLQLGPFMRAVYAGHSAEASMPFPSAIAITLIQKYIELLRPAYVLNIELQAESKVPLARVPALIVELLAAWDRCPLDASDVAAVRGCVVAFGIDSALCLHRSTCRCVLFRVYMCVLSVSVLCACAHVHAHTQCVIILDVK